MLRKSSQLPQRYSCTDHQQIQCTKHAQRIFPILPFSIIVASPAVSQPADPIVVSSMIDQVADDWPPIDAQLCERPADRQAADRSTNCLRARCRRWAPWDWPLGRSNRAGSHSGGVDLVGKSWVSWPSSCDLVDSCGGAVVCGLWRWHCWTWK